MGGDHSSEKNRGILNAPSKPLKGSGQKELFKRENPGTAWEGGKLPKGGPSENTTGSFSGP